MQPTMKEKIQYLYEHRNKLDGYMLELVKVLKARIDSKRGKFLEFGHNESIMIDRAFKNIS